MQPTHYTLSLNIFIITSTCGKVIAAKKENRTLSNYIINKLEEDLKMDDQKFYATLCDPTTGEYYTVECDSAEQAYELECGC